jgi:hypothetical protein
MEFEEHLFLLNNRVAYLKMLHFNSIHVGNIEEKERLELEIQDAQYKLDELIKKQEDANRESELSVD